MDGHNANSYTELLFEYHSKNFPGREFIPRNAAQFKGGKITTSTMALYVHLLEVFVLLKFLVVEFEKCRNTFVIRFTGCN